MANILDKLSAVESRKDFLPTNLKFPHPKHAFPQWSAGVQRIWGVLVLAATPQPAGGRVEGGREW
jgi:hypothetical protein